MTLRVKITSLAQTVLVMGALIYTTVKDNADERTVTAMADMMNFPKKWEQFLHDYEFEDARRIYTNGSRLIPSYRVKQMVEHYFSAADVAPVRHGGWLLRHVGHGHYWECSVCHKNPCIYVTKDTNFCPNCGAKMDLEE